MTAETARPQPVQGSEVAGNADSPEARFARYMGLHAATDGWFSKEAATVWDSLLAFQDARGIQGHMMEIGVWHGKSAALMAQHADASLEICFLVDLWLKKQQIEATLNQVRPGMAGIKTVACDSRMLAVSPLVAEGYGQFRWFHIDGEHTGGAVYNDLILAHSLLGRQGIVCLDDFLSWLYPQITEAVFRYVRENPDHFSLFLVGYNKAFLARPHFVHEYQEHCAKNLVQDMEVRGALGMLAKTTLPAELNCFGIGPRLQGRTFRGPDWDQDNLRL